MPPTPPMSARGHQTYLRRTQGLDLARSRTRQAEPVATHRSDQSWVSELEQSRIPPAHSVSARSPARELAVDPGAPPDTFESPAPPLGSPRPRTAPGAAPPLQEDRWGSVPESSALPPASSGRRSEDVPTQSGIASRPAPSRPTRAGRRPHADGHPRSQPPSRSKPVPHRQAEGSFPVPGGRSS